MIIGLDLRCLPTDGSEGAGVAHAARWLCQKLTQDETFQWVAYVPRGAKPPLIRGYRGGLSFSTLVNASSSSLKHAIQNQPCDLLFVPSGAVSWGLDVPCVPWVHDLTIFDHPEWFPQNWLKRQITTRLFLRGLKQAPIVCAVSEYTKRAIVRHARIPSDKVLVTYEGGDETLGLIKHEELLMQKYEAVTYCQKYLGLPQPFILCLGTVEPRKNIALLIRAWRKVSFDKGRRGRGCSLVIAGQDGWKFEDVTREINSLSDEQRPYLHRLKKPDDHVKRQLLLAAQAVAIPSLDEGFGLVALEALQAGTRVIASNRGALPEVIGQAGALLDPEDEGAWVEALTFDSYLTIAGEGGVISVKTGIQKEKIFLQSDKFSWEKSAEVVLKGLKRIKSKTR